jgi:hypothetical protein
MSYEFQGRTRARTEAETGRRPAPARAPRAAREPGLGRSPLQTFAAIFGAVFLLVGIAGFIPGVTDNYDGLEFSGPESTAELLGLFQVSILHNIVHLLFGVGLLAAARYSWSRLYLLGGGLVYLLVALYGAIVDHESDGNFLPINDADTILHVVLGLGMLALGLIGIRLSEGTPATRT